MRRTLMLFLALTFIPAVVLAQQPCTTNARQVVDELYRHMLEREPDAGTAHWAQQLQDGRVTVRDLVRQIAKSDEHTQRFWRQEPREDVPYFRAVGTLYRHILGRQPDVAGARSWADEARRSGVGAIVDQIVSSPEYDNRFGDWGVPEAGIRYCPPNSQTVGPVEQGRFRGMDRNSDGVISRAEWRGNPQSFENQDWNNDEVLSGDELDGGAARFRRTVGNDTSGVLRAQRFDTLDINGNDRIEAREWNGTAATFNRFDVNNDNYLSRAEWLGSGVEDSAGIATRQRYEDLDINRNGRIEPREWGGNVTAFNRLDVNDDNYLSRAELDGSDVDDGVAVSTSGQVIRVNGRERWTDTGIDVRPGETLIFDAEGTVRLSRNANDIASAGGALSGRRAAEAPLVNQTAGALIGRIGMSDTFFIGSRRSVRALATGRLYLGVNDDYLADNSGDFQVDVAVQR